MALQYGVPLRDLVNKFAHVRFEPSGFTGNQEIPIAKSIVDYIFRWLGSRFLGPDDKAALGLVDRSATGGYSAGFGSRRVGLRRRSSLPLGRDAPPADAASRPAPDGHAGTRTRRATAATAEQCADRHRCRSAGRVDGDVPVLRMHAAPNGNAPAATASSSSGRSLLPCS